MKDPATQAQNLRRVARVTHTRESLGGQEPRWVSRVVVGPEAHPVTLRTFRDAWAYDAEQRAKAYALAHNLARARALGR